jgi:hypothetical protein
MWNLRQFFPISVFFFKSGHFGEVRNFWSCCQLNLLVGIDCNQFMQVNHVPNCSIEWYMLHFKSGLNGRAGYYRQQSRWITYFVSFTQTILELTKKLTIAPRSSERRWSLICCMRHPQVQLLEENVNTLCKLIAVMQCFYWVWMLSPAS